MSAKLRQMPTPEIPADDLNRFSAGDWEEIMLANAIRDEGARVRLAAELSVDDFVTNRNREVFRVIQELGSRATFAEIANVLYQRNELQKIDGLTGLTQIDAAYVEIVALDAGIRILRNKTIDRQAYAIGQMIQAECANGFTNSTDVVRAAQDRLSRLESGITTTNAAETIGGALRDIEGGLQGLLARPQGQITTPWPLVNDRINGGFQRGELWLLAARPGVGKSAAALQIGLHSAMAGLKTYFVSLEMPKPMLLKRLIAMAGQVPMGWLMSGDVDAQARARISSALGRISKAPLTLDDESKSLSQIMARIAKGKYDLAIVDYLGLVETKGKWENRVQEVSHIGRSLKRAAGDHNIPVLALSQLNRGSDIDSRPPHLSDLRESGSLEQDADAVIMLHQPGKMRRTGDSPKDQMQVLIQKQRNGPFPLTVYLQMQGEYCRMVETTNYQEQIA